MNHVKLSNKDWACIEERFQKKLSSWKGKLLSVGGRLVLINSVLTSLAMFMLSFFMLSGIVIRDTQSKEVSAHADSPGWLETY